MGFFEKSVQVFFVVVNLYIKNIVDVYIDKSCVDFFGGSVGQVCFIIIGRVVYEDFVFDFFVVGSVQVFMLEWFNNFQIDFFFDVFYFVNVFEVDVWVGIVYGIFIGIFVGISGGIEVQVVKSLIQFFILQCWIGMD